MFKVNDVVVHKRDICRITEIKKCFRLDEDYYKLVPICDCSLVIHTPISDDRGLIRNVISKADAKELIKRIPEIEAINLDNDRMLDNIYSKLIETGKPEDLIKIIKTTYLRRANQAISGRKASEKDKSFFNMAEKLLYTEFSIPLELTIDQTRELIINHCQA